MQKASRVDHLALDKGPGLVQQDGGGDVEAGDLGDLGSLASLSHLG